MPKYVVSAELFQRLFRQDLPVASLFRNFLLAERLMRRVGCTPCSSPALPPTWTHPLWLAWEHAVESFLTFVAPFIFPEQQTAAPLALPSLASGQCVSSSVPGSSSSQGPATSSNFFANQLTAFYIWLCNCTNPLRLSAPLSSSSAAATLVLSPRSTQLPEQLPIVLQVCSHLEHILVVFYYRAYTTISRLLQVLLSNSQRTRALDLLCRFLDCGVWAIGQVSC